MHSNKKATDKTWLAAGLSQQELNQPAGFARINKGKWPRFQKPQRLYALKPEYARQDLSAYIPLIFAPQIFDQPAPARNPYPFLQEEDGELSWHSEDNNKVYTPLKIPVSVNFLFHA
nr:hypothetical protein [Iodobacter violacea]